MEVDAYDETYIAELVDALLGVPAALLIGRKVVLVTSEEGNVFCCQEVRGDVVLDNGLSSAAQVRVMVLADDEDDGKEAVEEAEMDVDLGRTQADGMIVGRVERKAQLADRFDPLNAGSSP